jgi:putative inorganic carbon (hco3(-)) transporter
VNEISRSYASEVKRIAGKTPATTVSYATPLSPARQPVEATAPPGETIAPAEAIATTDTLLVRLRRLEWRAYVEVFLKESFAFKMACIYLMIEYVRPQSIWTFLDVLPLGLLSLAGGVVVVLFSSPERNAKPYGSQLPLLGAFLGLIVLSILGSQYPAWGWGNLSLYISWMMAYFLISKAVNNERRYMVFLVLFLLFSFKMSQHGFKTWAASGFRFNKEGVNGAPGWFQNSGEVGIQMCIFLPMLLYFMNAGWRDWNLWKRGGMCVVALTVIGTVVGSSSRGALIGSGVVLFWMLARSRYKVRGLIAVAAVAAAVAFILPPEFYGRMDSMGEDNSSQMRLQYWAYGWELMKQHPVLGVGYFNWFPTYAAHLIAIGEGRRPEVCHNIFVQAGSELGFPGVLFLLAFIIATFVLNARTRKLLARQPDSDFLRQVAFGLDAGMIGYLISAQFITVLYYPYLWIDIALVVALHNVVARRTGMPSGAQVPA